MVRPEEEYCPQAGGSALHQRLPLQVIDLLHLVQVQVQVRVQVRVQVQVRVRVQIQVWVQVQVQVRVQVWVQVLVQVTWTPVTPMSSMRRVKSPGSLSSSSQPSDRLYRSVFRRVIPAPGFLFLRICFYLVLSEN